MRRVIHKIFWIWQLEAEENWINEMASHGYSLEHAGRVTFEFEESEANKYKYKSMFLKGSAYGEENQKYFRFLEEMGIKVVCTIGYPGTCIAYTRALAEDYPEGIDLYSDIDSKINYHKAMAGYLIFVVAMTLFAALLNLTIGINNLIMYGSSISILNLICGGLMIGLFIAAVVAEIRLITKINRLKKERAIHE